MSNKLKNSETILVAAWVIQSGQVVADDVSKRIDYLTQSVLKKLYLPITDGTFCISM